MSALWIITLGCLLRNAAGRCVEVNVIVDGVGDKQNVKNESVKERSKPGCVEVNVAVNGLDGNRSVGEWSKPDVSKCAGSVHDGRCYIMGTGKANWTNALAACKAQNQHLVDITTLEEMNFVKQVAKKAGVTTWLGGSDGAKEGTWVWSHTNTKFNLTAWYPGDPDGDKGQNCLELWKPLDYAWIDDTCEYSRDYICESN